MSEYFRIAKTHFFDPENGIRFRGRPRVSRKKQQIVLCHLSPEAQAVESDFIISTAADREPTQVPEPLPPILDSSRQ
ncbi:uncharacterized protein CPUR_01936 [Claviceps purpurea 20.1]|uniref:Uncharacterized protein n=1 Tax=Claviceps purpurea (strain 20.1) TaxID=1111077 RepID=M1VZV2_CLAP2|nr:uncharacterized protein CPUR_01936 [Claviceps purpurea 20.1]